MEITFRDKKLEKLANDPSRCRKELGNLRTKLFLTRLKVLREANNLAGVRLVPGHFHELSSDRKGQWACDLDQPYRLIFTPIQRPIPTDDNGKYIWEEILCVEMIEIVNYHSK